MESFSRSRSEIPSPIPSAVSHSIVEGLQDHGPLLDPQAVSFTNASLHLVDQESDTSITTTPSIPTQIADRNPEVQKLLFSLRSSDHNQDAVAVAIPPNLNLQHSNAGIGNEMVPIDFATQNLPSQNSSSHFMPTTSERADQEKTRILLEELRQLAAGTSMQTVRLEDGVANSEAVYQTANLPQRDASRPAQYATTMQNVISSGTSNVTAQLVPPKKLLDAFTAGTDDICIAPPVNTQSISHLQPIAGEVYQAKRSQRQTQTQTRDNDREPTRSVDVPSRKILVKAAKDISASIGLANRPSRSIRKVTVNHGIQGDQSKISKSCSASNRRSSSTAKRKAKQRTPGEIPAVPPIPPAEDMDVDTDLPLPELSTPFKPETQRHSSRTSKQHKTNTDIIMSNTFSQNDETTQAQQPQGATNPPEQPSPERLARHVTPEQHPSKDTIEANLPYDHDGGATSTPLKTPPRPRTQHVPRTPRSRKQKKDTDPDIRGSSSPKKRGTGQRNGTLPVGPLRRSPRIAGRGVEEVGELAM